MKKDEEKFLLEFSNKVSGKLGELTKAQEAINGDISDIKADVKEVTKEVKELKEKLPETYVTLEDIQHEKSDHIKEYHDPAKVVGTIMLSPRFAYVVIALLSIGLGALGIKVTFFP